MKNRIAFVLYQYPLGVSLMVVNSIKMFAEKGIKVDVYMDEITYKLSPIDFNNDDIRLILYRCNRLLLVVFVAAHRMRSFFSSMSIFYKLPKKVLLIFCIDIFLFSYWLRKRLDNAYDYVFPIECRSLVATADTGCNLIYYNMELLDWSEDSPVFGKDRRLLKTLEYEAVKNVHAVALQNENRAKRFSAVNHYDKRFFILPVAATGEPVLEKTSLLREKFNIPPGKKIVVYSGNITPWAMCLEMVESVKSWPEDFCLVIHTWNKNAFSTKYGGEVKQHAQGLPVYFSLDYIDAKDLANYLSSADIALMFYEAIDENFTEILFSSNKLAEYLKAGLPVITSDFPELRRFFAEKGIGYTVGSMEDLPGKLLKILERRENFHGNVVNCYQENFRFEKFFEPFYKELYCVERKS